MMLRLCEGFKQRVRSDSTLRLAFGVAGRMVHSTAGRTPYRRSIGCRPDSSKVNRVAQGIRFLRATSGIRLS